MATTDTVCFADHDPVTGAPTLDGFTGIEDAGIITSESEPGYVLGERLTFGGGSAFPPVIFQGVKNGNFLNFAFFCRFDLSFDHEDSIVIALRPDVSIPTQTTARRIDLKPVFTGLGAGPGGLAEESVPPGVPLGVDYHIRTDKAEQQKTIYKGTSGAPPWTVATPTNVSSRVRSWLPPVPDLTTSVGAQSLPNGTFNVVSTAGFPGPVGPPGAVGLFEVAGQIVTYTGKTGTSFTGCSGGAGAIAAGTPVRIPEAAWSAEVQFPLTDAGAGGTGEWIDIHDSFGLYFAVIRVGQTTASGPTLHSGWSTQFLFPVGTGNFLTGALTSSLAINPAWYGTALVPALQVPPGSNLGLGVRFQNGVFGIGVRDAAAAPGTAPGGLIEGPTGTHDNTLVAQVENTGATSAPGVTAEFRFANWGLGPSGFAAWQPASGAVPMPTAPATVAAGGSAELTSSWPKASVPNQYSTHPHQCVWVQLDSGSTVNFVESSQRRNMDFEHLSEFERDAEISGVGYYPPPGGKHDFILFTHTRQILVPDYGEGGDIHARVAVVAPTRQFKRIWVWILEGYRRTGKSIEIDKRTFEILDDTPGSFGFVLTHDGPEADVLTHELTGGGIKAVGDRMYTLKVPHDGAVTINTKLKAAPIPPGKDTTGDGCLGWLFRIPIIGPILRAILEPILKKP
jgi:hypothetical protein